MPSSKQTKSLIHFCQREDLTALRQDILSDYRDRISASKRTKLTSDERQTLIDWFIESLKNTDNQADIQALCETEIALLEEGYPQNTIASDILAKYRKAIAHAIDQGDLPLTDNNSHHYTYTKRDSGEQIEAREHYALTYLKYNQQTYQALRNQGTAVNNERQDHLQPVQLHRYLEQLQELLHPHETHQLEFKLAIAIAGATGRRHTEVLSKGHFSLTSHPYLLQFEGQQKKKEGEPTSFAILTILPATEVKQALERFRALPSVAHLDGLSSASSQVKSFNVQVNRVVQKLFQETGIVPVIPGKNYVSIHRLRGVYGAIAIHFFCPEFRHEHRFLQNYLGHVLDEQVAPNSPATPHYFHYYLVDQQGNRLGSKGVKLSDFPFPEADSSTVMTTTKPPAVQPPSASVTSPPKSPFNFIDSNLDENLKQSLEAALSEMLASDHYTVLLAGLMAVTGRSPGELLKSGTFELAGGLAARGRLHRFTLVFSSTGLGAKSTLKTLIDASVVLELIQKLRNHDDVQSLLYQTPSYINDHCHLYVTQAINKYLPFDSLEALLDNYLWLTDKYTAHITDSPLLISDDHWGQLQAIANQINLQGSASEILQGLLHWVEEKLHSSQESDSEALPEAEATDTQPPLSDTPPISEPKPQPPSVDPTISQTFHYQAQTIVWLTQRLEAVESRPLHTAATSPPDAQVPQAEVKQLKSQLQKLQTANDSLSNQVQQLQAHLTQVQSENQELLQSVERFEAAKRALLGEQLSLPLDPPQTQTPKTPQKKTSRKTRGPKGIAKQKAHQILEAITQWNQQHPDDTWALNAYVLESYFGIHRKAASEFLGEQQSLIDQLHRDSHVQDPRVHNRGKDTEALKAFVQPFLD